MKILFIGDIVGKPARKAVVALLPKLKEELQPDIIIANLENLSHGKGMSRKAVQEMLNAGIDIGTGGNHTFSKPEAEVLLADDQLPLVRPMNMEAHFAGEGMRTFTVRGKTVTVINLLGEHGMFPAPVDSPFHAMTRVMQDGIPSADAIIVDMHADTTSEKINMGWYLDGKVSAVLGTHTHVTTADERILPGGTGYITDVGMVGLRDSSLGVDRHQALKRFLEGGKAPFEIPDTGDVELRAVLLTIENGKTIAIERVTQTQTIS